MLSDGDVIENDYEYVDGVLTKVASRIIAADASVRVPRQVLPRVPDNRILQGRAQCKTFAKHLTFFSHIACDAECPDCGIAAD